MKVFVTLFSGTVRPTKLKLGTHVDSGWTRMRLLLLIHPFISSFFLLSNFQTLKLFVPHFSVTGRPTKLKLDLHMENGLMYCVYWNQAAAAYLSLYLFIFLSNFQTLKHFRHTFLRHYEASVSV